MFLPISLEITWDLCNEQCSCVLLHLEQLFTDSYIQCPLLWGLEEDISSAGSWGTAISDGIYDAATASAHTYCPGPWALVA